MRLVGQADSLTVLQPNCSRVTFGCHCTANGTMCVSLCMYSWIVRLTQIECIHVEERPVEMGGGIKAWTVTSRCLIPSSSERTLKGWHKHCGGCFCQMSPCPFHLRGYTDSFLLILLHTPWKDLRPPHKVQPLQHWLTHKGSVADSVSLFRTFKCSFIQVMWYKMLGKWFMSSK